jgi:site-specific DNA recombinase
MAVATELATRVGLRYRRMSFDDSAEQLRRQEADVDALCELHGYRTEAAFLFTDEDESGNEDTRYRQGKGERPGLAALDRELHRLALHGTPVTVVAWEPGRLFRDAGHKEHYFRRWARAGDVLVHTKAGVWNPRDGRDRFVSTVIAAGDQFYSDSVREKVVRAHEERRNKGRVGTGFPGFGYRRSPEGEWMVEPIEAQLIRTAAAEILSGKTATEIVKEWTAAGVRTTLGGRWTLTTLRRVLTKPALAGIVVHAGRETGKGTWEPILEEATLRRLQRHFSGRLQSKTRSGSELLTGVLYCGRCDGLVKLNSNTKGSGPKKRVYGCRACGGSNVDADAVEAVYVEFLWRRLDDPAFRASLAEDDSTQPALAELAVQEEEVDALKLHADALPVDVYVAKFEAISEKIAHLRSQLHQAEHPSRTWLDDVERLKKVWPTMEKSRQRALLLDVIGPSRVSSVGTSGRRVTWQRILDQLTLLEGPLPS